MNNKDNVTFTQWFAEVSGILGLHNDVNHPSNRDYDYVAAYYAGVPVPSPGQELPSEHKGDLHKNRFIPYGDENLEFFDSKTGQEVGVQDMMVQDVKRQNRDDNFLDHPDE